MYLDESEQTKEANAETSWNIKLIIYIKLLPTDLSPNTATYIHSGEGIGFYLHRSKVNWWLVLSVGNHIWQGLSFGNAPKIARNPNQNQSMVGK